MMQEPFPPVHFILRSSFFCGVASLTIALASLVLNNGFGSEDLPSFVVWTVLFSIGVGVLVLILARILLRIPTLLGYITAILLGTTIGVIWTMLVIKGLGLWMLAFSFPAVLCWGIGGASGLVTTVRLAQNPNRNLFIEMAQLIGGGIVIFLMLNTFGFSSDVKTVTVLAGKWVPGSQSLSFNEFADLTLTPEEKDMLVDLDLTGTVEFHGSSSRGEGEEIRIILVMQGPLVDPVELAIPTHGIVIYTQDQKGWNIYPPNVTTTTKKVRLYSPTYNPQGVHYSIAVPGGTSGGGLLQWPE